MKTKSLLVPTCIPLTQTEVSEFAPFESSAGRFPEELIRQARSGGDAPLLLGPIPPLSWREGNASQGRAGTCAASTPPILIKVDSKKVAHVPMSQVVRMLGHTIRDILSQEPPTDKHGKKPEPKEEPEVKEAAKS